MRKGQSLEIHSDFISITMKLDMRPGELPECVEELSSACAEYNCRHILGRVDGPLEALTVADVFEMATFLANTVPALQVALLVGDEEAEELQEFFRVAASNRGLRIKFFTDEQKALRWLGVSEKYLTPEKI